MNEEVKYLGHGSNTGGLQQHSLGADYPFTVVGTLAERLDVSGPVGKTRYFVLDCSNGKTFVKRNGRTYASCSVAHTAASWLAGDPAFDGVLGQDIQPILHKA
jgi:hypothetical protein